MNILKIQTKDGIELQGILTGEPGSSDSIIIHIHGMAGSIILNSFYPHMYKAYPENRLHFLAVTHRGTGVATEFNTKKGTKVIGNAFEKFEDCIYDIDAWITKAAELGYKKIWLQSHSLGPSKVAYYLDQTNDNRIDGLIWLSPADMLGLVHTPDGQKDHDKLMPEARKLVKNNRGDDLLSNPLWGTVRISAETYINFFSDDANTGVFCFNNLRDDWSVVNAIDKPVLVFTGTNDSAIVPVKDAYQAMEQLEKELKNSPQVKTVVFEGAEHDFEGFDKQIVTEVISFIKNNNPNQ